MKKRIIQGIKITGFALLGCLWIIATIIGGLYLFVTSNSGNPHNKKADDAISHAISEAVGTKELYYGGNKRAEETKAVHYEYYIAKAREGLIETAAEAVNVALEQKGTDTKIAILFKNSLPEGEETVFELRNYREDSDSIAADYEKLQYLGILGTKSSSWNNIYNNPIIYRNLKGIRYLKVSQEIQKNADEQGIDWHEYWPELETIEVYPGD